ncbi:MAG: scpB [Fibrobacteres bacterium]|nr:scpB [Fibrobacterota bacterium]
MNLPQDPSQDPVPDDSEKPGLDGDAGPEAPQEEAAAGVESSLAVSEGPEAAEGEEPESVWTPEPDKLLCALLFASQDFLSGRTLKEIMGDDWDLPSIRRLVKSINKNFEEQGTAFEVVEVDGTFRIRTRTQYYPWVRKLFKDSNPRRLSQASLETLAIIAYKQPITKAEIESIRGVNVDGCMKSLLEKKLVDVNARADNLGGAFSYSTTREFMRYFGISRVPDDLPRLSEFEAIVNAQALIPQIASDGTFVEMSQPEPDGEQMSLDQLE